MAAVERRLHGRCQCGVRSDLATGSEHAFCRGELPPELSRKRRPGTGARPGRTTPEEALRLQILAAKLPDPIEQHLFGKGIGRKWRFDFAWLDRMLAVEVEGGVYVQGRHTRGSGFTADIEKYNMATLLGWRVLRATPETIRTGDALRCIEAAFQGER